MDVEVRIRVYLEDAYRFVEEALREFEDGVKENNVLKIRDAAEKAWNAVIQASNALILRFLGKVPSSCWERRRLLRELEKSNPRIAELGFRDRYCARERNLHELVFYEGIIDLEDLRVELEKARKFVEDVAELISEKK